MTYNKQQLYGSYISAEVIARNCEWMYNDIKALKMWFQNFDANTSSPFEERNIFKVYTIK